MKKSYFETILGCVILVIAIMWIGYVKHEVQTNKYAPQYFSLRKLRESFNALDNSPLEKNLNEFQTSIGLS